jgi:hypothetical protein
MLIAVSLDGPSASRYIIDGGKDGAEGFEKLSRAFGSTCFHHEGVVEQLSHGLYARAAVRCSSPESISELETTQS